jgi:N-acetylglucosaminyl-diphospho-decaprenol L-rhamnosyltransferase
MKSILAGTVLYQNDVGLFLKCIQLFLRQYHLLNQSLRLTDTFPLELQFAILDNTQGAQLQEIKTLLAQVLSPEDLNRFHYLASPNIGFGLGHNLIVETFSPSLGFDHYLCFNPDGIPHPEMLSSLFAFVKAMETETLEKYGELTPGAPPQGLNIQGHSAKGLYECRQFPVEHPKTYHPKTGVTNWVSGCCVLIPTEIFLALKGFDPVYFLYCEDVDFSWRARKQGYSCYTVQDAQFGHYKSPTRNVENERAYMLKSGFILAHKCNNEKFKIAMVEELGPLFPEAEQKAFIQQLEASDPVYSMGSPEPYMNFDKGFYFSGARW